MLNLNDVKTRAAARLREPIGQTGSRILDSDILAWGNYAYYLVCKHLALLQDTYTITISSSNGQALHDLASKVAHPIIGLCYVTHNNVGPRLVMKDFTWILDKFKTNWNQEGTPQYYWISDKIFTQIGFAQYSATSGDTYEIRYVYRPTDLPDLTTNFVTPVEYSMIIFEWVWWNCQIAKKDPATLTLLAQGNIAPAFWSAINAARVADNDSNKEDRRIVSVQSQYDRYDI